MTALPDRFLFCSPSSQRAYCSCTWPHFQAKVHPPLHCHEMALSVLDTWLSVCSTWDSPLLMGKMHRCQFLQTSWWHLGSTCELGSTTLDREDLQSLCGEDDVFCRVWNGFCNCILSQICDTLSTPEINVKQKTKVRFLHLLFSKNVLKIEHKNEF